MAKLGSDKRPTDCRPPSRPDCPIVLPRLHGAGRAPDPFHAPLGRIARLEIFLVSVEVHSDLIVARRADPTAPLFFLGFTEPVERLIRSMHLSVALRVLRSSW